MIHEDYIHRCLELAKNGFGNVAPNPMVGAVVVFQDKIIGEGYHKEYGKAHAEVNAINSVKDKSLLKDSTLYVSLEPCCHFGKTPPCTELIINSKIKNVVVASIDPNPLVHENGIAILKQAGINVVSNVLEKDAIFLNRRFYTFNLKKRPYIILKWAQSSNNYIDSIRHSATEKPVYFLDNFGKTLVHKMRAEESAILIGKKTALLDNPCLTCRNFFGKNPTRIIIDRNLELDKNLNIFNDEAKTIIFNLIKTENNNNLSYIKINDCNNMIEEINNKLFMLGIQSIIIEGGNNILSQYIEKNLWDEARVFTSKTILGKGVPAPKIEKNPNNIEMINNYSLKTFYNDEHK